MDLYDSAKLDQMRLSTWYRDTATGEAVRIMLTEEGERKVRKRYGLSCDAPDQVIQEVVAAPAASTAGDGAKMCLHLPADMIDHLRSTFSSAAAASSGEVHIDAATIMALRASLASFRPTGQDSLEN